MKQNKIKYSVMFVVFIAAFIPFVVHAGGEIQLPKTGQTICYDAVGTAIICNATGQDGNIRAGVDWPRPRFTDHSDGTVTDNMTGMQWSKDANPAGAPKAWRWALDYIKTLNNSNYQGHNDWRLPNRNELASLVDSSRFNPALPSGHPFVNVQLDYYWTSTTYASYSGYAWNVDLRKGDINGQLKNVGCYVWPVRGGQSGTLGSLIIYRTGETVCVEADVIISCTGTGRDGEIQSGAPLPTPRFTDNGNQTVTDNSTGLVWSKDANAAGGFKNWQGALDSIKTLNSINYQGHNDWRLPNKNELASLVNSPGCAGCVDTALPSGHPFANVWPEFYWSSSTYAYTTSFAWTVNMQQSLVLARDKSPPEVSGLYLVWPVRGGQTWSWVDLVISKSGTGTGTVSSNPAGIICSAASPCSASFKTGQTISLTATPDAGHTFTGWSGGGCTGTNPCSHLMEFEGNTITATFADITAPTGSIKINNGAPYATNRSVTLNISATDAGTKVSAYLVSEMNVTPTLADARWVAMTPATSYSADISFTLMSAGDGQKMVYVWYRDGAGNIAQATSPAITLDTTAPTGSISINNGAVGTNSLNVTLTLLGTDNLPGTLKMAFSNDGIVYSAWEDFNTWKALTLSPGPGLKTVHVKFRDAAGNVSDTFTKSIIVDTTLPVMAITSPANGEKVSSPSILQGTVTDAGLSSGINRAELQVTDGMNYLMANGSWSTNPTTYFTSNGEIIDNKWSHSITQDVWTMGTTYTIKAKGFDNAGNWQEVTSTFTVVPAQRYASDLKMELSSQAVPLTETIDVTGKLSSFTGSDPPISLKYMDIVLTIRKLSDDSTQTSSHQTYDDLGYFEFRGVSFPASGGYELKVSIEDNLFLFGSQSAVQTVVAGTSAGYAILVQGQISGGEGLPEHNKTANSIYRKLRDRGFDDVVNIKYFNSYNTTQPGVDGAPSWTAIRGAVRGWASTQINDSPAPLYIILADHGTQEGNFHIYPDVITPSDLNSWLNDLEGSLVGTEARSQKIVVVIGSCYSGSFIPILSKAGSNRIIVTSAAQNEQSYRGPQENDNIRNGEYFLEEFFSQLVRGYSLKKAFQDATDKTRLYTRKDAGASNTPNPPYFDNAIQHPMLDDNGDGKGSNALSDALGDGLNSRSFFFGLGPTYITNGPNNPADIATVTDTLYLPPATVGEKLWLKVTPGTTASAAWLEIRSPSMVLQGTGGETQLTTGFDRTLLWYNGTLQRWEKLNGGNFYFNDTGRYEVFYQVRDLSTGKVSPMHRSVVYRNYDESTPPGYNENTPPGSFSLREPANNSTPKTVVVFKWGASSDTDGVTYNLVIATDSGFSNVVYRREEILVPVTYVDNTMLVKDEVTLKNPSGVCWGLCDDKYYYWKIEAVDGYGAITVSTYNGNPQIWHFHTDNTNGYPGILTGIIYTDQNFAQITAATIQATVSNALLADTASNAGQFAMVVPHQGEVTLTVSAPGYYSATVSGVSVQPGETTKVYVPMIQKLSGDIDRDGVISMADLILVLKICSRLPIPPEVELYVEAAINDNRIGLAEAIYILQALAEIR